MKHQRFYHLLTVLTAVFIISSTNNCHAFKLFGDDDDSTEQTTEVDTNYGRVSYAKAVDKAAPAVVSIHTSKEIPINQNPLMQDPFFRFFFYGDPNYNNQGQNPNQNQQKEKVQMGLGSGVIIDKRGYILTNHHVIKGASSIEVKLSDDRTVEAKIVGSDSQTDLAILKVELKDLPVIKFGTSAKLKVGDVVLAIGNPLGFSKTVTQGIVSAIGSVSERTSSQGGIFGNKPLLDKLIQTDASINPGNSGGALVDAYGNIVGINVAIISQTGGSQGIGFAIPIDLAREVMDEIIETGHIARGFIGTMLMPINDEIRASINFEDKNGIYVQGTYRNSPAQKAGILPGDIITKINDKGVTSPKEAVQIVAELKPGKQYPVEVFRHGDYLSLSVIMGQRPENN